MFCLAGSVFVGTSALSTSAAEFVPAKKTPKAAPVADESSLAVSNLKVTILWHTAWLLVTGHHFFMLLLCGAAVTACTLLSGK